MGLAAQVSAAVTSAKVALGDLTVSATLTKRTKAAYAPGSAISFTTSNTTVSVVIAAYSRKEQENSLIGELDVKILVFPASAIPEVGDLIVIGSVNYRAINVKATYAGSEIVLYVVQGRTD